MLILVLFLINLTLNTYQCKIIRNKTKNLSCLFLIFAIEYPSFNPQYSNKYEFSISVPVVELLNKWTITEDRGRYFNISKGFRQ